MWIQQIFVALLCVFLAWQQVAAVVNNAQSTKKAEELDKNNAAPNINDKTSTNNESDSVVADTDEKGNRREAAILPGDTYGAPLSAPSDTYLPSSPSNPGLPIPVYGVPDSPANNIVYPAPPPDIPPPVALPLPALSDNYGVPLAGNYLPPVTTVTKTYGPPPPKYETPLLSPPKLFGKGPGRIKPIYGPPRFQYGPPGKPLHGSKFVFKSSYKGFGGPKKPLSIYGPPTGYFRDTYGPPKNNFNLNLGGHSGGQSHGPLSIGPSQQYGPPVTIDSQHINVDFSGGGDISYQYGVPDFGYSGGDGGSGGGDGGTHAILSQFAIQNDLSGLPKLQYGPPQPSPHPRPPHPGAPAPPTPPDIKYDGWQPIPGLISRLPVSSYGVSHEEQHIIGDLSYNKDLIPPPLDNHIDTHQPSGSVANLALESTHGPPPHGVSDSYGAPLNTVTGSGGIVSSSGDEAAGNNYLQDDNGHGGHGGHEGHGGYGGQVGHGGRGGHSGPSSHIGLGQNIQHSGPGGHIDFSQNIQPVKSIQYEIFPSGTDSIREQGHGSGAFASDSYGVPPANSFAPFGPYAAAHSYNKFKTNSAGGFSSHFSHNFFNSHKSHGHKGLIPPNGVYGVPPSGQYGTPLYSVHSNHGSLNALKINPPKHPVLHREPVPPGLFDSIAKQHLSHNKHSFSGHHSSSSTYIPPPVQDVSKPSNNYGPPVPTNLYSLPSAQSGISFQTINHDNSNLNINFDEGVSSALTSYAAPLGVVESSYNQISNQAAPEIVGLDYSQPGITIDLTKGDYSQATQNIVPDCLKTQSLPLLPSLSYGVPSANSYSESLSTLKTNIAGAHTGPSIPNPSYGAPDILVPPNPNYGVPEHLPQPVAQIGYEVNERSKPRDIYGPADLDTAHSQRNAQLNTNTFENTEADSHGKDYGKTVAASFGPSSELIQSESIDLNNIPLKGALGSYTLQIQSVDGSAGQVPHGQVLNDGLLQSILAAIEQPQKGNNIITQPIIQFQKSLEQQNFATNDTISSVVGQLADAEIRHSTSLVKDEIDKTSEFSDTDTQHSSPVHFVVQAPIQNLAEQKPVIEKVLNANKENEEEEEEVTLPYLADNGIALYFSNAQRSKKTTAEEKNVKASNNLKEPNVTNPQ